MLQAGGGNNSLGESENSGSPAPNEAQQLYISDQEIGANDVLFGRGASIIGYEGNVRFRELVHTRKFEYNVAICHQIKGEVTKEIYREIVERRKGRFLKRVQSGSEAEELGVPERMEAWKTATEGESYEKIKQTLRGKSVPKSKQNQGSADASGSAGQLGSISGSREDFHRLALGAVHANDMALAGSSETGVLSRMLLRQQERDDQQNRQRLIEQLRLQQFQEQQQREFLYQQQEALRILDSDFSLSPSTDISGLSQHQMAVLSARLQEQNSMAASVARMPDRNSEVDSGLRLGEFGISAMYQAEEQRNSALAALLRHQDSERIMATRRMEQDIFSPNHSNHSNSSISRLLSSMPDRQVRLGNNHVVDEHSTNKRKSSSPCDSKSGSSDQKPKAQRREFG